jgi:sigma-54 dependent transcriptional regulator, acetoin dehydrogenase operon transcriptional activator AcoR
MNMTVSTPDRLSLLEQARLAVLFNGEAATPLVADWISHSWRRCLAQGLHPDDSVAFDPVSASHITRTLEQQRDFVQAAQPEIDRLCRAIAGTSFFALLTDAQGVVLDVGGRIDRHDKHVDAIARVGVDLSQQSVGTTAISAALTELRPVWLHRGEHFFRDTSVYSCAGAPIWGPLGKCIGMLDLTGINTHERPELMHLAALSARTIGNSLLLRQPHDLLLRMNWPGRLMGDDNDGLVLLSSEGEVLGTNVAAREMLNLFPQSGNSIHASDVFALPWTLLFDAATTKHFLNLPLWSGLHLQAKACVHQAFEPPHAFANDTGSLQQLQSAMIRKAIDSSRGNVAQAAKALGISRATLYRKLSRTATKD